MSIRACVIDLMGSDPYDGFSTDGFSLDLTGWHLESPLFEELITTLTPRRILEVGSWKGASAIKMAQLARGHDPTAEVLCVDTWLGSHRTLWEQPQFVEQLAMKHGFPQQYFQFLANVAISGLQTAIFPLPMTSYSAADVLTRRGLNFDLIYIDAHHDEEEVGGDIRRWYKLLRPGGIMFGDDYSIGEVGVIRAVNRFAADQGLYLRTVKEKWAVEKP
jgi:SAM-dependent methyltransferase